MKYEIIIFLFIPPIMVSIKFIHSVLSGKNANILTVVLHCEQK